MAKLDQYIAKPDKELGKICEFAAHFLTRMKVPEHEMFADSNNYFLYKQVMAERNTDPNSDLSPSLKSIDETLIMAGIGLSINHEKKMIMPILPKKQSLEKRMANRSKK